MSNTQAEAFVDADEIYKSIREATERERASPADEREAIFERLREFEAAERSETEADEGVPNSGEAPADPDKANAEREIALSEPATPPAVVIYTAPGSAAISVRLASPFTVDGVAVKRFDLLSPSVGDVEAVLAGEISENEMHARMAGLPSAAVQALRWDDAERVLSVARILAPEIRRS